MNTIKINRANAQIIAHRGLSGLEPENSIPAFVAAGNRSYYGVETDVHVTKDGKFVIIHDDNTERVAGDFVQVESTSYELLRQIRLNNICYEEADTGQKFGSLRGRKDLVIPSLEEYICICKKYEKKCVLELKNEFVPEDIARLVAEIDVLGYLENVIFISFALNNLIALRKLLPEQELYYLTNEYNDEIRKALKQYKLHLDIRYTMLTKEIIDELHADGILVNCWTCNRREDAEQLVTWGVDFITSNILE